MTRSDQASLYGKGIFTTLAIYDAVPFLWDKHWRRLTNNAERLKISLKEFPETAVVHALHNAMERDGIVNGRARITFYDERASPYWPTEGAGSTNLTIITGAPRAALDRFRLTGSPYTVNSRSPLVGVKSCNYLENILALNEAISGGFNEAIRLNEHGHVTSACIANIFWLKDGRLQTPALSTGCLAGTTREFVLENIRCDEVEAGVDDVANADAMFLTSAGLGIAAVGEFDDREIVQDDHPILRLLDNYKGQKVSQQDQ